MEGCSHLFFLRKTGCITIFPRLIATRAFFLPRITLLLYTFDTDNSFTAKFLTISSYHVYLLSNYHHSLTSPL